MCIIKRDNKFNLWCPNLGIFCNALCKVFLHNKHYLIQLHIFTMCVLSIHLQENQYFNHLPYTAQYSITIIANLSIILVEL